MTTNTLETPVLIVGGGPIGLTLALDLAWRGIDVIMVERRAEAEAPLPKCNHVAARSMEIFRRLGVANSLRDAGLPADYPNDISYRTAFTGKELTRIPIPCREDRFTTTDGPDANWPTPEPPHRINQVFLEPILFEHAAASPRITVLNQTSLEHFEQSDSGVIARIRDLATGDERQVACAYMIGCDGGGSAVRKGIGAMFAGDAVIQRVQSTYIRAPELKALQGQKPAWATFSLNPRRSGNVYAIDGQERWVVHNYLRESEPEFDSVDRDWAIRQILGVGPDFSYDVITPMDWYGRRLVADKFRDRRVFICGDAAHIWVPYAGYGMNAGIADATNLSWLLAAHLNGWAPNSILNAYEAERLPITQQVSHFVMDHAHAMAGQRAGVPANIEAEDAEGQASRRAFGQLAYDLNVQQYCCAGLNFGCYYDGSPIIAHDDGTAPGYSMAEFTPSTVPGCRTPHFWLRDGRSLYDAMGPEFTLLRFDPTLDVRELEQAAAAQNLPLVVLDIASDDMDPAYDRKLVLSRPDQHIAWRGDAAPNNPDALINTIRGAQSA
jgi:2-polyprenyl-6-methoxyphenol hydroxylase-like FAD-dependent oxidoreductase